VPRRKPRNLDAVRYELGTKERELVSDYIYTQALAKGGGALAIGAGIAVAGFFAWNTIEDIYRWLERGWETGFGLVEDPAATSSQVSGAIAPSESNLDLDELPEGYPPMHLAGMSVFTIYELGTQNRKKIVDYCTQSLALARGLPIYPQPGAGAADYDLKQEYKNYLFMQTWPFCLQAPVIGSDGTENAMSEYGYQITIREISARNDFAQTAGIGFAALGLGVQALMRGSGFMQNEAWDGNDWKTAPGAVMDPLLSFAWARTNFETGNWWSTADAPGGNSFASNPGNDVRADVFLHVVPGADRTSSKFQQGMGVGSQGRWSYEEVLYCAVHELENYVGTETPCPFLNYILAPLGMSVESVLQVTDIPPLTEGMHGPETQEEAARRIYEEALAQAGIEEEEEEEEEKDYHFGNPFHRTEEEQEEWQRELDRLIAEEEAAERENPGYGDDADDNGETEEERREREDEESGPPRV